MLKLNDGCECITTITQEEVNLYAALTGDINPIHVDEEYAVNTVFRRTIAHGLLVAGTISKVIGTQYPGEGTIYLEQNLKFLSPVFPNTKLKTRVSIIEILSEKKGIYRLKTIVEDLDGICKIDGFAIIKYLKK